MAWLVVRSDSGEELASFDIHNDDAYLHLEDAAPGLGAAVARALELDVEHHAAVQRRLGHLGC